MAFREINAEELSFNPFDKIGKEWMLITAGDEAKHNTMTASWGGLGIMWGKKVATVYIRPQRYTKEFVDQNERFTISFYKEEYRKALSICGSKSGRDCEKEKEAGLTPYYVDGTTGRARKKSKNRAAVSNGKGRRLRRLPCCRGKRRNTNGKSVFPWDI